MSENIVARGTRAGKTVPFKKVLTITAIVAAVVMLLGIISAISDASSRLSGHEHSRYCYKTIYRSDFYEDSQNNDLKSYKMDCNYVGNPLSLGFSNYFEDGGIMLPLLIVVGGVVGAFIWRKRNTSYEAIVTDEAVCVAYGDNKKENIPLCSIFTVEKNGEKDLVIVTSEKTVTLRQMDGRDEVYTAVMELLPQISIKGPANNEQVLAKGYPPAIKSLLLVLLILVALVTVIGSIASEMPEILLLGIIPCVILLVLFLLAKTPYVVVTDKRVFYVSDFGRKLSLPLNKITVTVTHQWFKQLHVAAATGRLHLFWVRNTAELYDIINALLNERQ